MSGMMGTIRGIQIRRYELIDHYGAGRSWDYEWKLKDAINHIALLAEESMMEAHAWVAEDPINRRVTFMRKDF